jgi:hypothetical protein
MRGLRTLTSLACAALAALTLGEATASADPTSQNPNTVVFDVVCPGMAPFQVVAVGAAGFVQGQRVIAIAQSPDQGSLDLFECTATSPLGQTFTVFVQFVQRG